jgi:hypothetical protein
MTIDRIAKAVACVFAVAAVTVPAALASPVLTENSNFKRSHAADPQVAVPLSENSYYSWSHAQDPQSSPPLSENSYYKWSHGDDPSVSSTLAKTTSSTQSNQPVVVRPASGFDFVDAGIGAAGVLGLGLLAGGSLMVVRSRGKAIAF